VTPRRLLLAGTVGSALLALGATGAGALPASGLDLLRDSTALALALCVIGALLLSAAWWGSRQASVRHQLTAAGLWALPLLLAPPLASRDAFAYVGQGALVAEGLDPYAVGPGALSSSPSGPLVEGVDRVWLDAPAPYGPLWLLLSGLVVRVTGSLIPALLGMRLLAVLGLVLVAWALPRIAVRHGVPGGRALWLGLANPLVLVHLVGGAHNEALMIGLMVAGVAVMGPGLWRPALAAALVTGAVLVKVPAIAALAYLPLVVPGWPARLRAAGAVAVSAVATAVLLTLASGLGWGWLTALDAGRARLSLFSPMTGLGVLLPGGDATLDAVLTLGLLLAVVLGAVLLLLRADRLGPVRALGLTLLGVSLLLPVVQPWYVLWGVMLLAAVSSARVAAALGVTCLVLVLLIAPSGRSVIRPPLYGVPMLLAVGAGAVVLRRQAPAEARRAPEHTSAA